jgi:hypothetical protein
MEDCQSHAEGPEAGAYHSGCIPLAAGHLRYRAVQIGKKPNDVSCLRSNIVCDMFGVVRESIAFELQ